MENTTVSKRIIGNAVIWAAMIIASALVVEDGKAASTLLFVMLAGWFASSAFIASSKEAMHAECAAFRQLFGIESK